MEGKGLIGVVVVAGATVIALGTALLHAGAALPPTPARPQPPPPPEALMNSELKYSPTIYRALIEQDAKKYDVEGARYEEMAAPNGHFEEITSRRRLRPRDPVDTAHLRLTLEVSKQQAKIEGQSYATEHLVLRVENRTDRHLAYRIQTDVPDRRRCGLKGDIPHNAIVLEPRQTLLRTECLLRGSAALDVLRAEVMELPALSAYYVSRLPAMATLYDARTASGHVPLKGELCKQTFSWRDLREGLDRRAFGWKDVIDFYARHSCDEYSFYKGYRYRTDAAAPLPARPTE